MVRVYLVGATVAVVVVGIVKSVFSAKEQASHAKQNG
jgi:hypothetical protein